MSLGGVDRFPPCPVFSFLPVFMYNGEHLLAGHVVDLPLGSGSPRLVVVVLKVGLRGTEAGSDVYRMASE